jgi:hypothetical protein
MVYLPFYAHFVTILNHIPPSSPAVHFCAGFTACKQQYYSSVYFVSYQYSLAGEVVIL